MKARNMIPNPLIVLLILFNSVPSFSNWGLQVSAYENTKVCQADVGMRTASEWGGRKDCGRDGIVDEIELLRLYYVSNGNLSILTLTRNDIKNHEQFCVDGYVCGIVALCDRELSVSVHGQELTKIRENADGTLSLKNFCTLEPRELGLPTFGQTRYKKPTSWNNADKEGGSFLPGAYSFFPGIAGDSVSRDPQFSIDFEADGKAHEVIIRQNDCYQVFCNVPLKAGCRGSGVTFRYLGETLPQLKERSPDYEAKLQAIADGIGSVEAAFDMKLVDDVNIVDFEDVDDAVTYDGRNDIWFYAEAFRKEPLSELRTMAEHESLHILVDKNNFARDSGIRKLFAKFKGYGDLSCERFIVVMQGGIPPEKAGQANRDSIFFAFINERNFLEGMKGGHPQNDMDEFCASFIHSLMYLDRIERNLECPLALSGIEERTHRLTTGEKATVLDNYCETLQTLIRAISESKSDTAVTRQTGVFLRDRLERIKEIREKWRMRT